MNRRLDSETVVRLRPPVVHRRRVTDPPTPMAPTERALLVRAGAGDASAWEALVEAHLPQVWRWAVAACADHAEAGGVCELVWLRLAQTLPGRAGEPLLPWLRRTVAQEAARLAPPSIPGPRRASSVEPSAKGPHGVFWQVDAERPPPPGSTRVR